MFAHTVSAEGITMFAGGSRTFVPRTHRNYQRILDAVRDERYDEAATLASEQSIITPRSFTTTIPGFELSPGGQITYLGEPFPEEVTKEVLRRIDVGQPIDPLARLLIRVRNNPSASSQRETLLFSAANDFLITETGMIVAYKAVGTGYHDSHSGTVCYMPAQLMTAEQRQQYEPGVSGQGLERNVTTQVIDGLTVVSIPRHAVDDNRQKACSYGLHVAAHEYAKGFASRLLLVLVDPADIVSVPYDHGDQKVRVCRLTVLAEIENPEVKSSGIIGSDFADDALLDDDGNLAPTVIAPITPEIASAIRELERLTGRSSRELALRARRVMQGQVHGELELFPPGTPAAAVWEIERVVNTLTDSTVSVEPDLTFEYVIQCVLEDAPARMEEETGVSEENRLADIASDLADAIDDGSVLTLVEFLSEMRALDEDVDIDDLVPYLDRYSISPAWYRQ